MANNKIDKMSKEELSELQRLLHLDHINLIDPKVLAEVDKGMAEMDLAEKKGKEWYRKQPLSLPAETLLNEDPTIMATLEVKPYDYGYIVSLKRYVEGRFVEYSTKCKLNIDLDQSSRGEIMYCLIQNNPIMEKV